MLYSLQIMELLLLDPTAGRTWARHFTAYGGYERLCSCLLLRSTTGNSSGGSGSISCSSMSPLQRQCLALVLRLVRAFVQNSDAISSSSSSGSSSAAHQQEDQLIDAGKAINIT
jgi:hypothetical protein